MVNEKSFKTQIARSSRDVIDFYDNYAVSWDLRFADKKSTAEFHRIRFGSFIKVANLKKSDRLVELGVGTGNYLDMIMPFVKEIICIDGSKKMLDILSAKYRGFSNIRILQMDLENPLKNITFEADIVYCFGLVEHIINFESFITNCKKMLKNNGMIIFITPNGRSPWYKGLRKLCRAGSHCTSDKCYTKEQLDGLMIKYGFYPLASVYWGYFPAGISDFWFKVLNFSGKLIDKTCLNRYTGGLTVSYILKN